MIFSGPPGTGKTMSAGITADFLGTTLYRVDLAAVVSKYIGETEKNLNAVFEAVKKGQGVLFFDEADVLFNKRVEVQNSNDRHSNMEAAYLLQKMEEYEGVVILATNYIQNIDEAFKRRIQFLIEFPFPDEDCRKRIWETVFPEQIRFDEIPDYNFLAKQFELSGSYIKNIALQAAFFAADAGKGICMEHIIKALLLEIRKTGKRISREDLKEYHMYYENI
ncbi:MAG: ATP-binding protein [Lachnospiraceae bacterium]|nr:ATP-binding protein [Lachnospiraceae bacterium]